jgi:hypothetical protein
MRLLGVAPLERPCLLLVVAWLVQGLSVLLQT